MLKYGLLQHTFHIKLKFLNPLSIYLKNAKTSTNPKKNNPWYNDDCKEAIKQGEQTLSRFRKFPTNENLNTYRNSRAKARRTIKSAKRKSWRTYVSKLNYKRPTKKVWDMVRKISGKTKTAT